MSSHFYTPDGKCIEGMREARKVKAWPSPTTVLQMLSSPALKYYFQKQMFEAAATTPRYKNQSDDDHFKACQKWADEHAKSARDRGGEFHDWCQCLAIAYGMDQGIQMIPDLEEMCFAYSEWFHLHVDKVLMVEKVVFGDGYAGRLDLAVQLKDGRVAVVDAKSQGTKGKTKFAHYINWALQLGAYAGTKEVRALSPEVLISIVVSSDGANKPGMLEAYEWPKHPDHYHKLFAGLLALWVEDNEYEY